MQVALYMFALLILRPSTSFVITRMFWPATKQFSANNLNTLLRN